MSSKLTPPWIDNNMPSDPYVFFDFDNTLSDIDILRDQYIARLSQLLAHETGDVHAHWPDAILNALQANAIRYESYFRENPIIGYTAWLETERAQVAADIFSLVGKPLPTNEPAAQFALRLQFDALVDCSAVFNGISELLHHLFTDGARIQMSSSQESQYLLAALMGAGIESYVESKFGPDLIDCAKEGPEYFTRIFAELGIDPAQAIVVDDLAICLEWAQEVGARIVQVRLKDNLMGPEMPDAVHTVEELRLVISEQLADIKA